MKEYKQLDLFDRYVNAQERHIQTNDSKTNLFELEITADKMEINEDAHLNSLIIAGIMTGDLVYDGNVCLINFKHKVIGNSWKEFRVIAFGKLPDDIRYKVEKDDYVYIIGKIYTDTDKDPIIVASYVKFKHWIKKRGSENRVLENNKKGGGKQ